MDYIGIALIIAVVVASVHFVHKYAYKAGMEAGIYQGRLQILEENMIRENHKKDPMIIELESYLSGKEVRIEKKRV